MKYLIFIFLLFSSVAFADETYWDGLGGTYKSSPQAACAGSPGWSFSSLSTINSTTYDCRYTFTNDAGDNFNLSGGYVYGTVFTCPASGYHVDKTGSSWQCVPGDPPQTKKDGELCDDQTGAKGASDPMIFSSKSNSCVLFSDSDDDATCAYLGSRSGPGSEYKVSGSWVDGVPTAPPTFAQDGLSCEVGTVSTTDCVTDVKGNVSCVVTGKYTGKVNNKTNVVDAKDAACPDAGCAVPEAQTKTEDKPCVYSGGADSQSCTSATQTDKDGSQQCGTVNGALTCVYSKPTSIGTKIDTTVTSQSAPDGSKTITKTDNATKTTCTDINKCTTSTSTTVTTSHQNAAGQSTGTSSTCKGACNSDGTGITPGKGTGTGDGSGDGNCDKDCVPGLSGEDSIAKTTQAFQSRIAGSPVAKAVGNIKISSGGVCYAPTIELFETAFVLDWHCQIAEKAASTISVITKAAWALLAVMVFLSA